MSAPKISALPWRLRDSGPPFTNILNADGELIVTVYPNHYGAPFDQKLSADAILRSYAEAEATAAFIVRAVNLHAEVAAILAKEEGETP